MTIDRESIDKARNEWIENIEKATTEQREKLEQWYHESNIAEKMKNLIKHLDEVIELQKKNKK